MSTVVNDDNTVTLDFNANTFTYFDRSFPQGYVFQNYGGTRNPVTVPAANTFDIPMRAGIYSGITYTYSNNSTYSQSDIAVIGTNNYSYPATPKDSPVKSIVFTRVQPTYTNLVNGDTRYAAYD